MSDTALPGLELARQLLAARGVTVLRGETRQFPDETIVIVDVAENDVEAAIKCVSQLEDTLPDNMLIVVRTSSGEAPDQKSSIRSIADSSVSRLIELLNERSRTSEQQPSLQYIRDAAENLRIAMSKRHHIVFGRRGVGKTALLLEAKRQVEEQRCTTLWINMQTLRGLGAVAAFLTIVRRICELPALIHPGRKTPTASLAAAQKLGIWAQQLSASGSTTGGQVAPLVPDTQRLINLICAERGTDFYVFVDDLHYLAMRDQPLFLDLMHGVTRDTSSWLKIAGIRNQCRVFEHDPPKGMQVGHDLAEISLDITLEEPKKARTFLSSVLTTYLTAAGIANRTGVLSNGALDRLVLASAGVPRDFLLLCARAIQIARLRGNARRVGAQDVNEAAGEAGKQKQAELEEDAGSSITKSRARLEAITHVREFAIGQNRCSFFRVDFRDKTSKPDEYTLLQSLMDLRIIHLVKSSLSAAHAAGERSEVYMIDLSEYSSARLMKNINVIELQHDVLVLHKTGEQGATVVGDTPRKLVQIFRTGPLLPLAGLTPFLGAP